MRKRAGLGLCLLALSCVDPSINEYQPRAGIIRGTVFYRPAPSSMDPCAPSPVQGNVIVTLFAEDAPPPPEGTASPINFVVVPQSALFAASAQSAAQGVFAAPFIIPTVEAGRYTVRAFLDADGDFNPAISLLAQPTAGDVGGGHVDLQTGAFLPVIVSNEGETAQVDVSVGLTFPVERPAFRVVSTSSSATYTVPFSTPQSLQIESHPVNGDFIKMDEACTRFLVQYVDLDGDQIPDDNNGDHLPDVYPTVLLRRTPVPGEDTVLVPAIVNPFPYLDALEQGAAFTDTLDLIIPPVAVSQSAEGERRFLPSVPAGEYEVIVVSGTGQTWQIPNDFNEIEAAQIAAGQPADASQRQTITMLPGPALPSGSIQGRLSTKIDPQADAFVVAFLASNPPPPLGTGTPVALASVPRTTFSPGSDGSREANFEIRGLADEAYLLVGVLDVDGDLSPLVELAQQPSAGDFTGPVLGPVLVSGGGAADAGLIDLSIPYPYDRPAFSFDSYSVPASALPASFDLSVRPHSGLGMSEDSVRMMASLTGEDADGDNLPDVFPQVLLTKIEETDDPRVAQNESPAIVIPGVVDPLPFLSGLGSGAPFIPSEEIRVILPPLALMATAEGLVPIGLPPAGRYRVNVVASTGQTWSVPNNVDCLLGRSACSGVSAAEMLADPTQARFVEIEEAPIPAGVISGQVRLLTAAPAGEYSVIVLAFAEGELPPPQGGGSPKAIAVVPGAAFGPGATADYSLAGLATGSYIVRAFLDANDDFTPWYGATNQPNQGDIGGGYLDLMTGANLRAQVDALGAPTTGIEVVITDQALVPTDRPSFVLSTPSPRLDPSTGSVTVGLAALTEQNDVFSTDGVFPVQWVDLNNDGVADDLNRDMSPDVFPLVVADQLDESGQVAQDAVRLFGIINPQQFQALGFPANNPSDVAAVVLANTITVSFPGLGTRPSSPLMPVVPPDGAYRITVINGGGQTWSLPNELVRAEGTVYPQTQGGALTVQD